MASLAQIVQRKLPYASVRGEGRCVLVSKCGKRWAVLLFGSQEARNNRVAQWKANGCRFDCRQDHATALLAPTMNGEKLIVWERI